MHRQLPNPTSNQIGLLDFLSLLTNNNNNNNSTGNNRSTTTSGDNRNVGCDLSLAVVQQSTLPPPTMTTTININNNHNYYHHQQHNEQTLSEANSSTSSSYHHGHHHQQQQQHHLSSAGGSANHLSSTAAVNASSSISSGNCTVRNNSSSKGLSFEPYVKEIRFEEQSLSAISCKYCRRNHRKCTRNLPSCSNCSKRGIKCEYERKNEGKTFTGQADIIVSIQNPSINDTSNGLYVNRKNVIGFYTLQLYEIIPKKSFVHMIETMDESGNDFKAVVFSLQAYREQRLGSKEHAEICFQHAKLLLAPYMDCFTNIHAGMALLNLAFVCQARRKYKEQSMYLDIIRYFVNEVIDYESKLNSTITPDMKNLIKWDTNLRSSLEFLLLTEKNGPISIVHYFPNLIKSCLGIDIRNMGFLDVLSNKMKINDVFNVFDAILRPFTQKALCPPPGNDHDDTNRPTTQTMTILTLFIDILHNGLKLALLVTLDNSQIDEIWNLSTIITKTAKSPLFPFLPLFVIPFIDLAISEHARLAPMYLKNANVVDIEKSIVLMEDMDVITSLNSKFDRVDDYYQNLQKKVQASMQFTTI